MAHENTCPDCGATPGRQHDVGCDVARCMTCGAQALGCDCTPITLDIWTGEWPGVAKCRELGRYCRFVIGHGWVSCDKDAPGATADLNRLAIHRQDDT